MNEFVHSEASEAAIDGLVVLVVEDEYLIANELTHLLQEHGAVVMGPAADSVQARALLDKQTPGCVLLDVNLKGQFAFALARELADKHIPIIFTTGYDATMLPLQLQGNPCLTKPLNPRALIASIRQTQR